MNIKTAPLWQWILLLIASLVLGFLGYGLVLGFEEVFHSWIASFAASLALIGLYVLVVRWFEKEWAPDILAKRGLADLLLGLAIGVLFFCVVVGVMRLTGVCTLERLSFDWDAQLSAFMMFFGVAVGEEILFRGVLFKWIDKRWGPWWALLVSGLVFGLVHVTNDNATWGCGLQVVRNAVASHRHPLGLELHAGEHLRLRRVRERRREHLAEGIDRWPRHPHRWRVRSRGLHHFRPAGGGLGGGAGVGLYQEEKPIQITPVNPHSVALRLF